jgi:hypothetical protein
MSLLTEKPLPEQLRDAKDAWVVQCAAATHNLAAAMRNAHAWLWSLPTDDLLGLLNHDVAVTLATFQQNTALGLAANAALDSVAIPELTVRAPVVPGRSDIIYDGEQFVFVPPPEPTPEPPTEPETQPTDEP